jgi:UDP-2,3-diacylglucosamine pyrophosphatase LpxH
MEWIWSMKEPLLKELYVVSDLHLGDLAGKPIFNQTDALADLIDYLARRPATALMPIGLVLNGDVFDTLPEKMKGYVCDRDEAEVVIAKIVASEKFWPIFKALRGYVATPGHRLFLVLGNHDLELIYPNVQELLLDVLMDTNNAAGAAPPPSELELEARRARVTFATAGIGLRCRVGSTSDSAVSVACVHGNEFDSWNAFDPETLARLARAGTLGRESALTTSPPNAGTRLVRDVMNRIKLNHPFVDLLKPETEGVFTILLALAPEELKNVPGFLRAVMGMATVGQGRKSRVLGAGGVAAEAAIAAAPVGAATWEPSGNFAQFLEETVDESRLDAAWKLAENESLRPEDLVRDDDTQVLGGGRLALNLLDYYVRRILQKPDAALCAALEDWGGSAKTWSLDGECDVFNGLSKLEPDVDVLIAGHTHLRRQKRLPASGKRERQPLYLNTGTWIRLIRLDEVAKNKDLRRVVAALRDRSMDSIDKLGPALRQERTVAVVRASADGSAVESAICDFSHSKHTEPLAAVNRWEKVQQGQ